MKNQCLAIVTPSYDLDFARCKLLCQSINYFIEPTVNHYIIVSQRDTALFNQLANQNTQIITIESIIPAWIEKLPWFRQGWISFKSLPIRNWLMQQITKIIVAQTFTQDITVLVDSDVVFVRPCNLSDLLLNNGKIRLFKDNVGNALQKKIHYKWHLSSAKLLGLSTIDPSIPDYISQIVAWNKDSVKQMCDRIESISGRHWINSIANAWHVSEYTLYGLFVDLVLDKDNSHYHDANFICHNYWYTQSLSITELERFVAQTASEQVAIMITSKADIPIEYYYPLLKKYFPEFASK